MKTTNSATREAEFVNSEAGKRILAAVRQGDFAHPGNTEAIDLALERFYSQPITKILDAGCGLGGTANYLQQKIHSPLFAVDCDEKTIEYASNKYPAISFFHANLMQQAETKKILGDNLFDLIYMFNVLYCAPEQITMLMTLRSLLKSTGELVIFDYIDYGEYEQHRPQAGVNLLPKPIDYKNAKKLFVDAGLELTETRDISDHYIKWYRSFLDAINEKHNQLLLLADRKTIDAVYNMYNAILTSLQDGYLGGALFYATFCP